MGLCKVPGSHVSCYSTVQCLRALGRRTWPVWPIGQVPGWPRMSPLPQQRFCFPTVGQWSSLCYCEDQKRLDKSPGFGRVGHLLDTCLNHSLNHGIKWCCISKSQYPLLYRRTVQVLATACLWEESEVMHVRCCGLGECSVFIRWLVINRLKMNSVKHHTIEMYCYSRLPTYGVMRI